MKLRYIVALLVCIGAIVWMITSLSANLNYLETVSQAVKHRESQGTKTFRIGGVVVPKTIDEGARNGARFEISDGKAAVWVHLVGADPPELFRACAAIVVQGNWRGREFVGDQVQIRHGSTYDDHDHAIADAKSANGCAKDA